MSTQRSNTGVVPSFDIQLPGQGNASNTEEVREKAQFWLNFGRVCSGKFVSITGKPVDKISLPQIPQLKVDASGKSNAEYRDRCIAQARLTKAVQERMATMQPGDAFVIGPPPTEGQWCCELRRVKVAETLEQVEQVEEALGVPADFKL